MRRIALIVIVLGAIGLIAAACGSDSAADPVNVNREFQASEIVNYGNDVYYFPYNQETFGNALSTFLNAHPELELVTLTGNGTEDYGYDRGYFAVFRPK